METAATYTKVQVLLIGIVMLGSTVISVVARFVVYRKYQNPGKAGQRVRHAQDVLLPVQYLEQDDSAGPGVKMSWFTHIWHRWIAAPCPGVRRL